MATPPWLEDLEGEEVPRLIQSDSAKIRVIAGPGSGKTTGLKRRVRRLLETGAADPTSIFVGTFTRAITDDLRDELADYEDRGVTVSTLHSHALSLLREHPHVQAGRRLRFLMEFEKRAMLYDVLERTEDDRSVYEVDDQLKGLQAAHAERRDLDDARFAGAVERWLRQHEAMLISEVVPIVTSALEGEDLPRGEFDHVVVDEYQDLTRCEQEMVELIWSGEGALVVLGDDAQSIYNFRYNHPDGVSGFAEQHPDAEDISIPENRRSGREIVRVANLMMEEAGAEREPMRPTRDLDGETTLVHWSSVEEEVEGLAEYMRRRADQDFLVLVPRKFVGYQLQRAVGDEARTQFREEVLDTAIAEERFTLATLLADPEDRVAARAWLGFHWDEGRGDRRNALAYLSIFDPNVPAPDMLRELADGALSPSGEGQKNVRLRAEQLQTLLDAAPEDLGDQIDYLFDPLLPEDIDDEDAAAKAARDLQRLREGAHAIHDRMRDPTLQQVVDRIRYRIVTRMPLADPEEEARVKIMTLHSAKGLEADEIVVAGAADQMIPGDEDRAEQRRLLFVAVTRARDQLLISWPRSVSLAHAAANGVRMDGDRYREAGETRLRLGRSSLLPGGGEPRPTAGRRWLQNTR